MTEAILAQALLERGSPLPAGLVDPRGRHAERRFNVYRNNVAVGLTTALEDGFPIVRKIVGDEFFAAMAGVFLRACPPSSPVLLHYGDEFAKFLSHFQPVKDLHYLPDVARLEFAIRQSYHAADAAPIGMDQLSTLGLDRLLSRRVKLAPSLQLIVSNWPIFSIWEANVRGTPLGRTVSEAVLILRPAFDPMPTRLPETGAAMVQALQEGAELGQALSLGTEADASELLSMLLNGQAITEILE